MNHHSEHRRLKPIIVAVDGPAGSGKSSVCSRVCQKLGWTYINTGFLYRAIAVIAKKRQIDLSDERALYDLAEEFAQKHRWQPETQRLWFGDIDLTLSLGTAEAGNDASFIAKLPEVRRSLLPVQRLLAKASLLGAIVDGRDIGTVVFPDADLKIYMTASLEERARRRHHQLSRQNHDQQIVTDLAMIQKEIARRDEQDAERNTAPLKKAEDAIVLDTSGMDVAVATQALLTLLKANLGQ